METQHHEHSQPASEPEHSRPSPEQTDDADDESVIATGIPTAEEWADLKRENATEQDPSGEAKLLRHLANHPMRAPDFACQVDYAEGLMGWLVHGKALCPTTCVQTAHHRLLHSTHPRTVHHRTSSHPHAANVSAGVRRQRRRSGRQ